MAATNKNALAYRAAKLFVAPMDASIPEVAVDLTNAPAVITAIEALSKQRMASLTDLQIEIGGGESEPQKVDDNGVIYRSQAPSFTVKGNWFEMFEPAVLKTLMGLAEVDDTTGKRKILGQKIQDGDAPRLALIIETIPQVGAPKPEKFYLVDTNLTGSIVLSFLNVKRNGGVGNSPFSFASNDNGAWIWAKPTD